MSSKREPAEASAAHSLGGHEFPHKVDDHDVLGNRLGFWHIQPLSPSSRD